MPSDTTVYILRHATPTRADAPNRQRPLSELGRQQAHALVPFLKTLRLSAVFSSPFLRALETVRPYCDTTGVDPIEREDLRESEEGEPISQVRERLWGAITSIVDSHPKGNLLVCTHGGCAWSIISHFDPTFDFQDYKQIRTPDMRKIIFDSKEPTLDQSFKFNALLSCKRPLR